MAVANDTDNCHVIEFPECVGHAALMLELFFAQITPCLEVVRVAVVLDESDRHRLSLEQMLADNCTDPFSVRPAIYRHWLSGRHRCVCGLTPELSRTAKRFRLE